jgi:GT2 family glycosyltransferase
MASAPTVALMVLNWNGADLMRTHLPAVVHAASVAKVPARVYVIDNASDDDSREVIASFPGVELIGFADNRRLHAYNEAVALIECSAFMMLNNDVSPRPDVLDPMWDILRSDPSVFAVAGDVIDTASGGIDSGPTSAHWERQWVLEAASLAGVSTPTDVPYVSGGAGLYRREMFLALDGFWNALPGLYWEDVELGLRAWLHGWRSVYHPSVRFDHASGSTVRRALNPYLRELRTYQNVRLAHWSLLLDRADLRDYLAGELRRSLRKPYYYPALLTMIGMLPEVVRRRRSLRRRCGSISVAELQSRWRGAALSGSGAVSEAAAVPTPARQRRAAGARSRWRAGR